MFVARRLTHTRAGEGRGFGRRARAQAACEHACARAEARIGTSLKTFRLCSLPDIVYKVLYCQ